MILVAFVVFSLFAAAMVMLPVWRSQKLTKSPRIMIVAGLVPVLAIILYMTAGAYNESPHPHDVSEQSMEQLLDRVEGVLVDNPDDSDGWRLLARSYGALGRLADRERAIRQLIRIEGATAEHLSDLGEVLVALAGNVVTTQSKELFGEAVRLDPNLTKARYWLGVALRQEGREEEAARTFERLLTEVSPNSPWHGLVRREIGDNLPGPTAADIADAEQMTPEDRQTMIEGMVASLAYRLQENPEDIEGWMRLIRSYIVLENREAATDALAQARAHFEGHPKKLEQLGEIAATHDLIEGEL